MREESSGMGIVAFSISFYIVTAIVMVIVNKAVLNSIDLPITFLTIQIIIAVLLLLISGYFKLIRLPKLNLSTCWKLFPLVSINVLGLTMNTLCLKYVDASFYQVARALVLPFTVILSRVFLGKSSSYPVLFSCLLVCCGFLVGTNLTSFTITKLDDELNTPTSIFSDIGVIYGVLSSVTTAMHAIVIKQSLDVLKGNTLDLVYYNNVLSAFGLIPILFIVGEFDAFWKLLVNSAVAFTYNNQKAMLISASFARKVAESDSTWTITDGVDVADGALIKLKVFVIGAVITGIFGFLINVAGFLQIKVTSPVTHMISSAVRGVIQTVLAVFFFHDVISEDRAWGIVFILAGSSLYSLVKSFEAEELHKSLQKEKKQGSRGWDKV